MAQSVIKEKAFKFSVKIVNTMRALSAEKKEFDITRQLLRSGTSIGANVYEGGNAESKKDFIHKHSISLKEAHETHYWIRLLMETDLLDRNIGEDLKTDCDELIRILSAIIRSAKSSLGK